MTPQALQQIELIARDQAFSSAQTGALAFVEGLHRFIDARVADLHAQVTKPACQTGCDACCHRLILATPPEIELITQEVGTWDEKRRERLRMNLTSRAKLTKAYTLGNDLPCPFLEDHRCMVYEKRPARCRGENALDPTACAEINDGKLVAVPQVPGQMDMVKAAFRGTNVGLKAAGLPAGSFDLADAIARWHKGLGMERALVKSAPPDPSPDERLAKISSLPVMKAYDDQARSEPEMIWKRMAAHVEQPYGMFGRMVLPTLYRTSGDRDLWLERLNDTVSDFEKSKFDSVDAFESMTLFSTFHLAYAGRDVKPLLTRLMARAHAYATKAYPELTSPIERPRRAGKFRLGFISRSLTHFNGSMWALGWLRHLKSDFETYSFNIETEDGISALWARYSDHYYHMPIGAAGIARQIKELDLDALIFTDIAMGGRTEQLSLLRLARRQLTAWGHPVTSGSPNIDDYLSSDLMEPSNGQEHYSENLIRLPHSGLTMPNFPRKAPSSKSAGELGVPKRFLLNAQRSFKLLPEFDHLYSEISERSGLPIVFLTGGEHEGDSFLGDRLRANGVNAIVLERCPPRDFLRLLELAECSLDSPGWNGGNTTYDALCLGKPVITLPGEFMRGRHTLAFLKLANVPALIAKNEEEYVNLSVDFGRQQEVMKGLQLDALFEDLAPVRAIEDLLLSGQSS
jgi:Fe-S-cluster containining protein